MGTTMSRLVFFLMLLSLMVVVVNSMPGCKNGITNTGKSCLPSNLGLGKREALDAPMAHKTKRGSKSSSWSSSSSTITKCTNGVCSTKKTECKNGKCRKGKREALDAPMAHKTKRAAAGEAAAAKPSAEMAYAAAAE